MNCERIQEVILTDYLDGQLDAGQRKVVDQHLSACSGCTEFLKTARTAAFAPFSAVEKQDPSETVWSGIKESILAEQNKNPLGQWLENIQNFLFPKQAWAIAAAVAFVLASGVVTQTTIEEAKARDNSEYLESLTEVPGALSLNNDFETSVEQYFL